MELANRAACWEGEGDGVVYWEATWDESRLFGRRKQLEPAAGKAQAMRAVFREGAGDKSTHACVQNWQLAWNVTNRTNKLGAAASG